MRETIFVWLNDPLLGWWVLAALTAVLIVWRLAVHTGRVLDGWRRHRRQSRARRGEQHASRLLARAGWEVVDDQVTRDWTIRIDESPLAIPLRADYIVETSTERAVAEVKTGADAPSLRHSATRRQLLEYRLAFDVDTILIVDAERDTVRRVDFDAP